MTTNNAAEKTATQRSSTHTVREIVTALNRADLRTADYAYLVARVGELIKGIPMRAASVRPGTTLYRGVIYKEKPGNVSYLSYPPAHLVKNYQRCNGPGSPMFYCSVDSAAVFAELDAQPGDKVYLSKWIINKEFFFFRIPPDTSDAIKDDAAFSKIETFFETRFAQPIHETYSEQYKLTAAITEKFSTGNLIGDAASINGRVLGAVAYRSVAHTPRSDNVAIRPSVVDQCLQLTNVREVEVVGREGESRTVRETDFSANFEDGKINWAGRPGHWTVEPGGSLQFAVENGEWVARSADGTVVDRT
ncbi:hypothetical protein [Paraburkholderia sp. J12]|uniref:hypothetical protein n=1 Tax=Paraburkholderia sp. J12 TaxID=2805432 RepID=UPI002ABE0D37|nr:hypothetical protein [Paraburkholderia sp. J12]